MKLIPVVILVAVFIAYVVYADMRASKARAAYAQAGPGIVEGEDFRQVQDRAQPSKAFGQACFFVVMGGKDYGYFDPAAPQKMLASSWEIGDRASAMAQLQELLSDPYPQDVGAMVFDRLRAMFLARSCAGAEYLSQEESWQYITRIGRELQSRCHSFEEVGQHYLSASLQWSANNGVEDDGTADRIAKLRGTLWVNTNFQQPLG